MAKKLGDIKTLYAYYRFSDFAMTNIGLTEKSLSVEEVWFEGFMDWTFTECIFNQPFHFGVEGAKIEEDTRGTTENPVPHPGYGSNGLHFNACDFSAHFEIKDNCVVVFKDCDFNFAAGEGPNPETQDPPVPIIIEDGCRVEFINCNFEKPLELRGFCEVRFRGCTFLETTYSLLVEDHCKVFVDKCTQTENWKIFLEVSNDCEVIFNDIPQIRGKNNCVLAKESSVVKLFTCDLIESFVDAPEDPPLPAIKVESGAKFEARYITTIKGASNAIVGNQAEFFMQDIESITVDKDSQATIIELEDTFWRSRRINEIIHVNDGYAIYAVNSRFLLNEFETIQARLPTCIRGEGSAFEINDGDLIQVTDQGIGVHLTGAGKSIFRNITTKIKGCSAGIKLADGPEVYVDTVGQIIGSIQNGIVMEGDSSLEVLNITNADEEGKIEGLLNGIITYGNNNNLRVKNVQEVIRGKTVHGINLTNTLYDLQDLPHITGLLKGAELTNCRGLVSNLGVVEGQIEEGCHIIGVSGPTDWDTVLEMYSPIEPGLHFEGDAAQIRMTDITEIHSMAKEGMVWDQTGGTATFYDCEEIYSIQFPGARITIAEGASLEMKRVNYVYSEILEGMILTCSGRAHFYDGKEIYSQEYKGLVLTSSAWAKVGFHTYDKIWSMLEDAINVTISDNSSVKFFKVAEIYSEEKDALTGTVDSQFLVTKTDKISAPLGQIVGLSGSGTPISFTRFEQIALMESETPPGDAVSVTKQATVELEDIDEITVETCSGTVVSLAGRSADYGIIKVLDCKKITAETCETVLKVADALISDVVGTKEKCELTGTTVNSEVLKVEDTSLYLSNYSKITAAGGEGHAIDIVDSQGKGLEMRIYAVDDITGYKDGIRYSGNGTLKLVDLPKVAGKSTSDNALYLVGDSFAAVTLIQVETETDKGKISLDKIHAMFTGCIFNGDFTATASSGQAHTTEFNTSVVLETSRIEFYNSPIALATAAGEETDLRVGSDSSAYLFLSNVSGSGKVYGSGALTADVTEFDGDNFYGHGAVLLNKCDVKSTLEAAGGLILNRSDTSDTVDITGAMIANEVSGSAKLTATAAVFLNGSTFKELEVSIARSAFLNGCGLGGPLTIKNGAAVIFNGRTTATYPVTAGAGAGVIMNTGQINSYTAELGVATILNSIATVGAITLGDENAAILNRMVTAGTGTAPVTIGKDSGVILNRIDLGSVACASTGHTGLIANWMKLKETLGLGKDTGAILAAPDVGAGTTVPEQGCMIAVGAFFDTEPSGDGKALVLTDDLYGNPSTHALDVATALVMRGVGTDGQILLKTDKTSEQFGEGATFEDVLRKAEGTITDSAGTAVVHIP